MHEVLMVQLGLGKKLHFNKLQDDVFFKVSLAYLVSQDMVRGLRYVSAL